MSSFDSLEHTDSKKSLAIVVRQSTYIIDKFEPEAQTTGSRPLEYTGPLISSKLSQKQLHESREMYGVPSELIVGYLSLVRPLETRTRGRLPFILTLLS